jgi:hypothetical protein
VPAVNEDRVQDRQRLAAQYLRELLLKPGPYRDAWQERVDSPRDGVINQLAVAEVIANRVQPSVGGVRAMPPYQVRETVSSALYGTELSNQSLQLFIDAFGFAEHEADRLRRLSDGSAQIGIMSGKRAVPEETERQLSEVLGKPRAQSLTLHDHVYIGRDRRIERARILQVLQAIVPDVDRIPFVCDTKVMTLEVGQGGKEVSSDVRQIGPDIFVTDVLLARKLDLGETITIEYWLTYRYPGDLADPQEREYRRGVFRQIENYEMRVEFSSEQTPAHLWWARWDSGEGDVVEQKEAALDSQHSAHRFLRRVEKTVVGFWWEW